MKSTAFKMRTFNAGANHEIILPNGKVVLVDPYFIDCKYPGFSRDDVTGADYIIITHGHFDHDSDLGYFVEKFNAKVFCGVMVSEHLMKFHKIPYDNLFPVFPNSKITMEDLTLEFWQAKHNGSGGYIWTPPTPGRPYRIPGHEMADMWGSMESLDWMLTTNNGFRVMMASGRTVFLDVFDRCKEKRPNVLLRQAGIRHTTTSSEQVSAKEMAELLVKYGAQLIFPFHMDVFCKKWGDEKTAEYMAEVTEWVNRLDPGSAFIYPEPLKWYHVGIDVTAE